MSGEPAWRKKLPQSYLARRRLLFIEICRNVPKSLSTPVKLTCMSNSIEELRWYYKRLLTECGPASRVTKLLQAAYDKCGCPWLEDITTRNGTYWSKTLLEAALLLFELVGEFRNGEWVATHQDRN